MQLMFVSSSDRQGEFSTILATCSDPDVIVLIRLKHRFYLRLKTVWPVHGLNVLESQDLQAYKHAGMLYTIQKYFNVKQFCVTLHVLTMQSHYQEKVAFYFGFYKIHFL